MNAHKIVRMLEAVLGTRDQELTCAELDEEQLARYADLELSGGIAAEHLPQVGHHLALCPDCWREYRQVLEVLRLEREGRWIEPTTRPAFDLSFLISRGDEPGPWAQIGSHIRRYIHRIPALLLPQLEQSGRLPPGLRLSYAPAIPARMRGPQVKAPAVSFHLEDAEEDLYIQVQVNRVGQEAVWVAVHPTQGVTRQPLAQASVGLHDDEGQPLEIRALGPEGLVRFKEVVIGREYALRLVWDRRTWEIPLDLRWEEP